LEKFIIPECLRPYSTDRFNINSNLANAAMLLQASMLTGLMIYGFDYLKFETMQDFKISKSISKDLMITLVFIGFGNPGGQTFKYTEDY